MVLTNATNFVQLVILFFLTKMYIVQLVIPFFKKTCILKTLGKWQVYFHIDIAIHER